MKKLVSLVSLAAFFLCAASPLSAQLRFGVKAGLNLANIAADDEITDGSDPKILPTFQVGGLAEFALAENLGVSVGVQLSGKGFRFSEEEPGFGEYKVTANPLYLQVPLSVYYSSNGFYIGAGPYLGFGIGGKIKESFDGDTETTDIEFGDGSDDDDVFAPLDFGANLEVGYTINNAIRISASYSLGLANALPKELREDGADKYYIRHRVIGVSAAYLFGGGE
jgi:hypothetical protein